MIYNDDFNNITLKEKADLILIDIPYNIGKDAYASNPQWWKNGNIKDVILVKQIVNCLLMKMI